MQLRIRWVFTGLIALSILGCASFGSSTDSSGFLEQLYKNSDYSIGQIVELNNELKQVEITYDPIIPEEEVATIEGWNIAAATADAIQKAVSDEVGKLVTETVDKNSSLKLSITLTDVKTRIVPKYVIFKYLQGELEKYPELRSMIGSYIDAKRKFNVITQIISAKAMLTVVGSSATDLTIPPILLSKINTKMSTTFVRNEELKNYQSGTIAVGIISDPLMMESLLIEGQ